ncbi:MAG: sigma-70 family RNA polymerase sigma factor [Acidimicrobiales bacterium]
MANQRGRSGEDEDLLQLYLNDIGKYPLLDRADEVRLGRIVRAGQVALSALSGAELRAVERKRLEETIGAGRTATAEFVRANLRLVVSIAKRYQTHGMSLLDVIQEGNFGLIQAVERFDPDRGFKFSTYATWWIRQTISRGIANSSRTIRLPVHAGDQLLAIRMAATTIEVAQGRVAKPEEVALAVTLSAKKVQELMPHLYEPVSLSERLTDGDSELGDVVEDLTTPPPDQAVFAAMLPAQVAELLSTLEPREQEVLCLRYGLDRGRPRTLEEVGDRFGLTREGVRQVEMKAISKLRRSSTSGARDLLSA